MMNKDKAGTGRKSLGALLLHGGDWNGIRIMGLGERLAVIGVSAVTALCVAGPASHFLCRGEMRRDPGRRDGDGNRRDGGREDRVEALQEPSADNVPAPLQLLPAEDGDEEEEITAGAVAADMEKARVVQAPLVGVESLHGVAVAEEGAEEAARPLVEVGKDFVGQTVHGKPL